MAGCVAPICDFKIVLAGRPISGTNEEHLPSFRAKVVACNRCWMSISLDKRWQLFVKEQVEQALQDRGRGGGRRVAPGR